jgi:general stress protein 26
MSAAVDIMRAAGVCALITVDESGRPQARTMDALPPEPGLVVWIATNPKTRKVNQIRRDPRVALYYYDRATMSYVTLVGRARLVTDTAAKQTHWKKGWEAFWPDRGEGFLLIEVTPDRVEVVSPSRGINSDPITWAPRAIEFNR